MGTRRRNYITLFPILTIQGFRPLFRLNQLPNTVCYLDLDLPILIYTPPSSFKDSRGSDGIIQSGQASRIQISRLEGPIIDGTAAIDELLKRDIAVARLAVEIALLVGRVLHVERVVPHQLPGSVVRDVVTPLGLVNADLALGR